MGEKCSSHRNPFKQSRLQHSMVLFTFSELFDLAVMTLALGYIFMIYVQRPATHLDLLSGKNLAWEDFKFAMIITAPAVVLHELAHKFAALLMGLTATFHASYFGLGLGVLLRFFSSPFIVFVPGFVEIQGATTIQSMLTAFVGPGTNLLLFAIAAILLKRTKKLTQKQAIFLHLTKQINLFLFLFNMIPFLPFDGGHVFEPLWKAIF